MLLGVLGRTHITLMNSTSLLVGPIGKGNLLKFHDGDRTLIFNEDFLVITSHRHALARSIPFTPMIEWFDKVFGSQWC